MPFTLAKLEEIEAHLGNNPYLSEGGLPAAEDARIFVELNYAAPDVTKTPNFHYWFHFMSSFSLDLLKNWVEKAPKVELKAEDDLFGDEPVKQAPKVEQDDLFGDDPVVEEKPKPKVQPKKKKEKPAAKSIVMFDVKIYDQETDLDKLAEKILKIEIPGLVWNNTPTKAEVAFGIFKLQMGCVIEDDKVQTDDIFEPIEAYPEVQSVDMTGMQKL